MKKILFLFLLPLMISAQNLNGRFSSALYTFERFDSQNNSDTFIRNFESLALNFNYKDVSLRTRMNYESNIGNSLESDSRLRFYNFYFEARNVFDYFTMKLGRQPLFISGASGLFDGANLKFKYDNVSLSGFYGGNVPAYQKMKMTDDLNNDYVIGGKFDVYFLDHFTFGLSYINKNFKPTDYQALRLDANNNPVTILIQQNSNQFKYLAAQASYVNEGLLNIDTHYEYDLNFMTVSKFELDGRVQATNEFGIDLYYNWREPRINYNSIFSVFNYGNSQEIEGGFDYKLSKDFSVFGKFGDVVFQDDNSQRVTIGVNTSFGSLSYRKTFGYAGELDGISIYTSHSFADGLITPSIGIGFTNYKLSPDSEKNNLTSILGGINFRPWTDFSFDVQGQYFNNKIYQNDFRLLVKINYWFNTNF